MQTFPSLFLSHHFAARGGPGAQAGGACPGPRVAPSSPNPWPGWKLMGLERGSPGRRQRPKEPDWSFGGMGKSGLGFTGSPPPPLPRAPPRWPFGDAALGSLGRCPCARCPGSALLCVRAPFPALSPPGRGAGAGSGRLVPPSHGPRAPIHEAPLGGGDARAHTAQRGVGSWLIGVWA